MNDNVSYCLGIDVSKAHLDLAVWPKNADAPAPQRFPNTSEGHALVVQFAREYTIDSIVMESTGGYEAPLAVALQRAGLPVAVVNPKRVRDFGKATGRFAKTDRIDAELLARFAQAIRPKNAIQLDDAQRHRRELIARRAQLIKTRTAENNRLEHAGNESIRRSIQTVMEVLNHQIHAIDEALEESVDADPASKEVIKTLRETKGVGDVTARVLAAHLPELGRVNRGRITALVGLAPFNNDSGQHRGKRTIRGGRFLVRSTLYMATLTARRCNHVIRPFYEQLRARGHCHKTAMVACMRKLLHHLNAAIARLNLPQTT